jgi:parallel beta-helix repeat protein
MSRKSLFLVFTVLLFLAFSSTLTRPANAETIQTIVINSDGSISPSTVPIQRNGNVYTFNANISATMRIEKSNVVIDGAGYTLRGPYNGTQADVWVIGEGSNQLAEGVLAQYTIGIDLANENVGGVVIKGLNIKNFSIALYMWTKNNTIIGNAISENIVGILLSGSNTTITDNYITNNKQGLFFGFNEPSDIPTDVIISHNGFEKNIMQINGCLCDEYPEDEPPHAWDNGKVGNYWSDYNGSDANNDGFGDTPYVVDIQNQDRFPLMQNPVSFLTPVTSTELPVELVILVIAVPTSLVVIVLALRKRKRSGETWKSPKINKKIVLGILSFVIIVSLIAGAAVYLLAPPHTLQNPTGELDFMVSGTSDCLRFLNSSVPTIYVPFTIAANENWQLTINATKMGGGSNAWTDVYLYKGYWDGGSNNTCKAGDLYAIINDIESTNFAIRANKPYVENFGGSNQESYTVFFVVPPSGQATFHISLKQV